MIHYACRNGHGLYECVLCIWDALMLELPPGWGCSDIDWIVPAPNTWWTHEVWMPPAFIVLK